MMEKPELRLHHIGINAENKEDALHTVNQLCTLFDLIPNTRKSGSPFAGSNIEVVPGGTWGKHGHLAFYVKDMQAGIAYLESKGQTVVYDSAKRNPDGSIYLIYLKEEIAGFAIHLFSDKQS